MGRVFVRKPTTVEAFQFDGSSGSAVGLCQWATRNGLHASIVSNSLLVDVAHERGVVEVDHIVVGAHQWAVIMEEGTLRVYRPDDFSRLFQAQE